MTNRQFIYAMWMVLLMTLPGAAAMTGLIYLFDMIGLIWVGVVAGLGLMPIYVAYVLGPSADWIMRRLTDE